MLSGLRKFRSRFDALRAQILADALAVFHHVNALNIWLELAPCRAQRVAAGVAKHRGFAAIFTFRHNYTWSLLDWNMGVDPTIVALAIQP